MIKYLVWDIGGVLLENPFIGEFWKEKEGSIELRHKFGSGKMSNEEFVDEASKMLEIKKENFIEEYGKAYFPIRKIKKVFEIFLRLKNKSYLFSDTNPLHFEFIKEKYPEMFEGIKGKIMSSEVGYRKSEDEFYQVLIKKIGIDPKELLLIDDSEKVVKKAKENGMNALFFSEFEKLKKDLNTFGVEF